LVRNIHRCKELKKIDPEPITLDIAYSNGYWWLDFIGRELTVNIKHCPWCGKLLAYIEIEV